MIARCKLAFAMLLWPLLVSAPSPAVLCIAHRGYGAAYEGNTLEAAQAAWDAGADAVEVDVRRLADGSLVLFHDRELQNLEVEALSYSELQALTPNFHVPMLAEVLTIRAPGRILLLDLKSVGPDFVGAMQEALKDAELGDGELWLLSSSLTLLEQLRAVMPEAPLYYVSGVRRVGFWKQGPQAVLLADLLQALNAQGIAARSGRYIDRRYIKHFQNNGLRFFVWDVKTPELRHRYQRLAVDGLISSCVARSADVER